MGQGTTGVIPKLPTIDSASRSTRAPAAHPLRMRHHAQAERRAGGEESRAYYPVAGCGESRKCSPLRSR